MMYVDDIISTIVVIIIDYVSLFLPPSTSTQYRRSPMSFMICSCSTVIPACFIFFCNAAVDGSLAFLMLLLQQDRRLRRLVLRGFRGVVSLFFCALFARDAGCSLSSPSSQPRSRLALERDRLLRVDEDDNSPRSRSPHNNSLWERDRASAAAAALTWNRPRDRDRLRRFSRVSSSSSPATFSDPPALTTSALSSTAGIGFRHFDDCAFLGDG